MSAHDSSPPPIARWLLGRLAKPLQSRTIQTTAYSEREMEADRQEHREPVRHSDNSSHKYQMSDLGEETELDTEPAGENLRGADGTRPRRRCWP